MSRTCPTCGTTFADQVFFCGRDGSITIEDEDGAQRDPRLGERLGQYLVVARVADGAMGRVYEGRHPETRARVAIKVLHPDAAEDPVCVERLKREYETASELDHRHIVDVLELGRTTDGSHFITMEYLEGEELGQLRSADQTQSADRVLRIVTQTALALEHAHSFGFIHRDLKPDNIFVCRTEDGDDVRVLDFGSVKLQVETGAKLTAFGTTLGSPFYMSPEQAAGRQDVDQRSDVFALTAIAYELLTGQVAFDAPDVASILVRIMHEEPIAPSSSNPAVPPAVDAVIAKGLRKDKRERYATALEMAAALLQAYGLPGDVERWAQTPEAQIAAALQHAEPPEVAGEAARATIPAPGAAQPDTGLGAGAGAASTVPSKVPGLSSGTGVVLGLSIAALVALGGVVALLIR